MSSSRIYSRTALVAGALFCLLAPSSAFAAGAPAAVTVRVEGLTETKVPSTPVTTTVTHVVKDGNTSDFCTGTSAIGALQLATAGNWNGPWEASFNEYVIFTIAGETHEFEKGASANYYWSFWLDNKESTVGACGAELQSGDQVLFFPTCYGATCSTPVPTPLAVEAPPAANVGEAVTVTVKQYNSKGEASPAVAANVGGAGTSASTDSQGHATLKFFGDGTYTLRVSGAASTPAIRTETAICVHEGNDGTCGTTLPSKTPIQPLGSSIPPLSEPGHGTVAADVVGLLEGRTYSRRHAPRVLSGKVIAKAPVTSITIRLRRGWRGRCWAYDGTLERFVKARCGHASFFNVGVSGASFSYLLPFKLPRGRYVFEIQASDAAGDRNALHRGSSRVVFYVK